VIFHIEGGPKGTQVRTADGSLLGTLPGDIRVPRGDTPIALRFDHDGYEPFVEKKILPSADRTLSVSLKKKQIKKARRSDEIRESGE
jgi:hypothetical protein